MVLRFANGLSVPIEFKRYLPRAKDIKLNLHLISNIKGSQQVFQQMILLGSASGVLTSFFTSIIFELQGFTIVGDKRVAKISVEIVEHEQFLKTAKAVFFTYMTKWARLSSEKVLKDKEFMHEVYLKSRKSKKEVDAACADIAEELIQSLDLKKSYSFHDIKLSSERDYTEIDVGFGEIYQTLGFSKNQYCSAFGTPDFNFPDQCSVILFIYDPIQGPGPDDMDECLRLMDEQIGGHRGALDIAYSNKKNSPLLAGQGFLRIIDEKGQYRYFGKYLAAVSYNELHAHKNISTEQRDQMLKAEEDRLIDLGLVTVDGEGYTPLSTLSEDGKSIMFLGPIT